MNLARFRADPEKVRVSIRRDGDVWIAAIESRVCGASAATYVGQHRFAYRAVVLALLAAERAELPGVDLSMGWTYEHPWGAVGVRRAEAGLR